MNTHDWSLVAFTILAQMSVGAFVILGLVHFFVSRKAGVEEADRMSDRALLAIGPVLLLGMLASFFHLGNPMNALNAINNLGSSWLSREIFCGVAFTVVGGAFAIMQWRKIGPPQLRNAVALLAAVIGLALVYSMANVYQLRTVPAWNSISTPLSFFTTTLLLGSLAIGAVLVANYAYLQRAQPAYVNAQGPLLRSTLSALGLTSIVLLGVEFVILPLTLASSGDPGPILIVRLLLAFLGAGLFGAMIYRNTVNAGREKIAGLWVYMAFMLVFVSEILGRFLFYAANSGFSL